MPSLAAVALLFLASACVLHTVHGAVEEDVISTIELKDDQAASLSTAEMSAARSKMVGVGLRSIRTRSFFTNDAGQKMVRTQYKLAGSTSRDRIIAHAHLLHKVFPKIFTEADVLELESIVERSKEDHELANALRNRPYITIVFSQVYRAQDRIEERVGEGQEEPQAEERRRRDEGWTTQVKIDHETGRTGGTIEGCIGISWTKKGQ